MRKHVGFEEKNIIAIFLCDLPLGRDERCCLGHQLVCWLWLSL